MWNKHFEVYQERSTMVEKIGLSKSSTPTFLLLSQFTFWLFFLILVYNVVICSFSLILVLIFYPY